MDETKPDILTSNVVKSCLNILDKNRSLIIIPILSGISVVIATLILYYFANLFIGKPIIFNLDSLLNFWMYMVDDFDKFGIGFLIIYFFVIYIILIYFGSVLANSVYKIVGGQRPTVTESLGKSMLNIPRIIIWAIISVITSVLFKVLERNNKSIGSKIFSVIAQISWNLLTYFVIPIIAIEKINIFEAIKKSGQTMKKTWGENIRSHIGFFFFFAPYSFFFLIILFVAIYNFHSIFLFVPLLIIAVIGLYSLIIINTTISYIFTTVLYIYASRGDVADGFVREDIKNAFK